MFQRDYLMRLIEEAGRAAARAAVKRKEGQHDSALAEIDQALTEACNMSRILFDHADAHTLAGLLGEPERIRAVSKLLSARAKTQTAMDDLGEALGSHQRALELELEISERYPEHADRELIETLREKVPEHLLEERYQSVRPTS